MPTVRRQRRLAAPLGLLAVAGALAGCSSQLGSSTERVEADPVEDRGRPEGSVFDIFGGATIGNVELGTPEDDEQLVGSVNRYLWRASLDTLSFLPLASTDPYTGVIATDWGAASAAPGERFKVTAYVTDVALRPEALRVAVFREIRGEDGAWAAAPVAPATPRQIEDSILTRARQLKIAAREEG